MNPEDKGGLVWAGTVAMLLTAKPRHIPSITLNIGHWRKGSAIYSNWSYAAPPLLSHKREKEKESRINLLAGGNVLKNCILFYTENYCNFDLNFRKRRGILRTISEMPKMSFFGCLEIRKISKNPPFVTFVAMRARWEGEENEVSRGGSDLITELQSTSTNLRSTSNRQETNKRTAKSESDEN